jgi:hypothetical protein
MDAIEENPEYRFERLETKHYKDLVYISKSAFNIDPGIDYFINKNKTGDFGETNLGFVAYHKISNEPAAFYGVYAHPYLYQGKNYFVVQSGDTMTHINHTGKGLFTQLAKLTYKLAVQNGAIMVYGFPNDNSYPGFTKKLNWIHRDNIITYKLKIRTLPLLKLAKKINYFNGLYRQYLKLINQLYKPSINSFTNTAIDNEKGGIEHSVSFFNYKRFNGSYLIKINDIHIWIKPDGFLFIGDIEKTNASNLDSIIKGLKKYAMLIGADVMQFGFSPNAYWNLKLAKKYSSEKGAAFGYLLFSNDFPIQSFEYTLADLDTF